MTFSLCLLFCFMADVNSNDVESIDAILLEKHNREKITPAEICSDEVFLRRATLDIVGRIPTLSEIEAFKKQGVNKRKELIDRLLASSEFPRFWSELFTASFIGYSDQFEIDRYVFQDWMYRQLENEIAYDQVVRKIIGGSGRSAFNGPANFVIRHREDLAVRTSRLFLGVRLDCARCHDHPFDRWTQKNFAEMNSFFEFVRLREVDGSVDVFDEAINKDELNELEEGPKFLTGARPLTGQWRREYALYTTNSRPFARTFANRMWYHFMGRGIVHPPDDFSKENPPSIPKLLEFLASEAKSQNFSLKQMIRLVCNSEAYQRVSGHSRDFKHQKLFASRSIKPLTAEQIANSLSIAKALQLRAQQRQDLIRQLVGNAIDEDYSQTWKYRESVQNMMIKLARRDSSQKLTKLKGHTIDQLFLRTLTRSPSSRERKICQNVEPARLVHVLTNVNEFYFNH